MKYGSAWVAGEGDGSLMGIKNASGDHQAEAIAIFFGGEERLEKAFLYLFGNAWTVVLDNQDGRFVRQYGPG